jgi:hypothetical protein
MYLLAPTFSFHVILDYCIADFVGLDIGVIGGQVSLPPGKKLRSLGDRSAPTSRPFRLGNEGWQARDNKSRPRLAVHPLLSSATLKRLFGADSKMRMRPSFFPFTEPSAELDMSCVFCKGAGCGTCSQTGWMEILGCGLIHPQVLRNVGIDPEEWSGFAFGLGLDRCAMIKFDIPNIRTLFENDLRVLQQF